MWPQLLDMTKEESVQSLRSLELEAYASLVTALRAQGPLNQIKLKVLKDISSILNITQDRYKAEIRRAVNDEKLNTIAYHVCGHSTYLDDWAQEGRWLAPLIHRATPQTIFSLVANEGADAASVSNKQLPIPQMTERRRNPNPHVQGVTSADNKTVGYKSSDTPKLEECRKRKFPFYSDNGGMMQYSMGPPKISKIQQLYRQRTKARIKEQNLQLQQSLKPKQESDQKDSKPKKLFSAVPGMLIPQSNIKSSVSPQSINQKINVLQNITVPSNEMNNEAFDEGEIEALSPQPGCSNENQVPETQRSVCVTTKPTLIKPADINKPAKLCQRNIVPKSTSAGQKLIVVSTPQTVTPSMLHRALTVPVVKSMDKFKIVSTTAGTTTAALPISTLKNVGMNSGKHKVVTVRTNALPKKVSLSHLQFLNAKGNIKVLPFGGKIITKTATIPTSNIIIVNSGECKNTVKSVASTPLIFTTKPQESTVEENSLEKQITNNEKSEVSEETVNPADSENNDNDFNLDLKKQQYLTQENIEEDFTDEVAENSYILEDELVEENDELLKITVKSTTGDESSRDYVRNTANCENNEDCVEEAIHDLESSFLFLGEENSEGKDVEQAIQNLKGEETDTEDVNRDILKQCVDSEGIFACDEKMISTNVSSNAVIYSND